MAYIYETHLHTIEGSACSSTPAVNYIDYMKSLGYSGVIVTDHFFNGNSAIPRSLPWEEKIERYAKGFEHMRDAAGDDLTVLFGVEYCFHGDEFLIYGIDKEWLLDNPDIMTKDRHTVYEMVHGAGAIMIQAHPYREREYLSEIHLTPSACDGAEVYNAANPDWQNALAYQYAKDNNLPMTAGSDIHNFRLNDMGGMSFPYPVGSIEELAQAFLEGDGMSVCKRDIRGRASEFVPVEDVAELTTVTCGPTLDVYWH